MFTAAMPRFAGRSRSTRLGFSHPIEELQPPAIFTPEQARTALGWLEQRPRALGWFVLSCLCGLRPEEAERTAWSAVDIAAGLVRVEAQTSKIRPNEH